MTKEYQDTPMHAGDTKNLTVTIYQADGVTPENVTGSTVQYYAKRYPSATPDISKSTTGGTIALSDPTNGVITVALAPSDTASLFGSFIQSLVLTDTGGNVSTVMIGSLVITEKVAATTRRPAYTTVEDVVSHLRLTDKRGNRKILTESTEPKRSEVEDHIFAAEDWIDEYCNDSWRLVASSLKTMTELYSWMGFHPKNYPVALGDVALTDFDSSAGDVLSLYDGKAWLDMLAAPYVEGPAGDWWADYDNGIVYIRYSANAIRRPMLKVKYRHGHSAVPYDIRQACAKLAALDILQSDFYKTTLPQGTDFGLNRQDTIRQWQKEIDDVLNQHRRIFIP